MKLMMLERRNMWSVNGYSSKLPMISQLWNMFICTRTCAMNENIKMCDILQANELIEKFSSSWSYYRNQLKHKKKDLTL